MKTTKTALSRALIPVAIFAAFTYLHFSNVGAQGDPPAPDTYTVKLKWEPSPEDNIAGYRILYSESPDIWPSKDGVIMVDAGNATEFNLQPPPLLDPSKSYHAAVLSYNSFGLESPLSNEVKFSNFQPSRVIGLRVTQSSNP
jgi:hypothetical protein